MLFWILFFHKKQKNIAFLKTIFRFARQLNFNKMKKTKFSALEIRSLRNDDFLSLCQNTLDVLKPSAKELEPSLQKMLERLIADTAGFEIHTAPQKGSEWTAKIKALDDTRDKELAEVFRTVKHFSQGSDLHKKENAKLLNIFLNPYKNSTKRQMNTETTLLHNLFDVFDKKQTLKDAATALEIHSLFEQLKQTNAEFYQIYLIRQAEQSKPKGLRKAARNVLSETYQNTCQLIVSTMLINTSPLLRSLFEKIEASRKEYHLLLQRKIKKNQSLVKNSLTIKEPMQIEVPHSEAPVQLTN
jgi:hypothetical protein